MKTNNIIISLICFLFFYLSASATAHTYNQSSGNFSVNGTAYGDNMNEVYNINTGTNKPVLFTFSTDIEDGYDYIEIYSVNSNGVESSEPIAVYTGYIEDGNFSTIVPSGRAKVVFTSDNSVSNTDGYYGFDMSFAVDNSFTVNNNLFVTGNEYVTGNVGIGTNIPLEKLHVLGNIRGNQDGGALRVQTDYGYTDIGPKNDSYSHFSTNLSRYIFNKPIYLQTGDLSSYYNTNLSFQTWGTPRMTILNSNGNVGIGNTQPSQALSVTGRTTIAPSGTTSNDSYNGNLVITKPSTSAQYINLSRAGSITWSIGTVYNTDNFAIGQGTTSETVFNNPYFVIKSDGKVGIGTTIPDQALTVNGIIHTREVNIALTGPLADFVFSPNYKLMPLNQVEQYVNTNSHLPEIPSATEVKEKGLSVGEMQNKLLQKIEELTLYVIEQQKQIEELKNKLK